MIFFSVHPCINIKFCKFSDPIAYNILFSIFLSSYQKNYKIKVLNITTIDNHRLRPSSCIWDQDQDQANKHKTLIPGSRPKWNRTGSGSSIRIKIDPELILDQDPGISLLIHFGIDPGVKVLCFFFDPDPKYKNWA